MQREALDWESDQPEFVGGVHSEKSRAVLLRGRSTFERFVARLKAASKIIYGVDWPSVSRMTNVFGWNIF